MEELKTTPGEIHESAPVLAAKALDKELNAASSTSESIYAQVNDLTAIVKKKKKPAPEANGGDVPASAATAKRKAEDDGSESSSEKKAKIDTPTES